MVKKTGKKIERSTTLGEIVKDFPDALPVMLEHGLHCVGCHVAAFETVEEGAKVHGMSEEQVDALIGEMNNAVKGKK
ncbi:MAG: DUF1858 domain-containing protein [Candidatus Diapherotrites archaeon]|uniref:DUF1858 domain-containing protein n=1 Tax=Candidatus Iainarchaeum sp. TaxID=3101447 RepID=A0A938YPK9_9ARCH|nr:DUF1858 domain-containing protein [Candidatus Diapherotrites archaeon]